MSWHQSCIHRSRQFTYSVHNTHTQIVLHSTFRAPLASEYIPFCFSYSSVLLLALVEWCWWWWCCWNAIGSPKRRREVWSKAIVILYPTYSIVLSWHAKSEWIIGNVFSIDDKNIYSTHNIQLSHLNGEYNCASGCDYLITVNRMWHTF